MTRVWRLHRPPAVAGGAAVAAAEPATAVAATAAVSSTVTVGAKKGLKRYRFFGR